MGKSGLVCRILHRTPSPVARTMSCPWACTSSAVSCLHCTRGKPSAHLATAAQVNVRTSLQPNRTLRASYLANACFSTLFLIDTLLPLWERWQDIPPSTITHYPQVGTEVLFGVDPECRAGQTLVQVLS